MNKNEAYINCQAVFNYAIWRYTNTIVSMTSNGITYEVDIQLQHADYDSLAELERLRNIIAVGARISHLQPTLATYDIIVITYRYKD